MRNVIVASYLMNMGEITTEMHSMGGALCCEKATFEVLGLIIVG